MILCLAYLLNAPIATASAIGAGLCDLLSGSPVYALSSTIIYAMAGLLASFILKMKSFRRYVVALVGIEVIVFFGYVATFCILYGVEDFKGVSLFYLIQTCANFVIGIVLYPILLRIKEFIKIDLK